MKTSDAGRAAIEQREGLRLRAYRDQHGVWTIGYGHTSAAGAPLVKPGMTITKGQADTILSRDLAKWEGYVNAGLTRPATQNQFDALVSFTHNVGPGGFRASEVRAEFNRGNIRKAANAFLHWEHPPSLKARREGERAQFLKP